MDPLGLFSEDTPRRNTSQIARLSSPVQPTDTLRSYDLENKRNELLQQRNALKEEVTELENQWNVMRNNLEVEDVNKEEDDLIWKLLVQRGENNDNPEQGSKRTIDDDDEEDKEDLDKFSAKPSKDWNLRIGYLKRFYPDLSITNPTSKTSLTYPESSTRANVTKIISFDISYPRKIIALNIKIHLLKIENTFKTDHLNITKTSNNKLNTSLLDIISHYTSTKNVNGLLSTLNSLYHGLQTRQSTLQELIKELNIESDIKTNVLQSQMIYKQIIIHWDLVFKDESIVGVINVNDSLNSVFTDLLDQYGVKSAFLKLVERLFSDEAVEKPVEE